jgi:hypothetical protein
VRALLVAGLLAALCAAGPGCISITTRQTEQLPDPKTPAKLEGKEAPPLEATAIPGVKRAKLDVPDVYYHEAKERWFRYALDRWFIAFLWNGQWYPVDKGELPAEMAKLEPTRAERKERKLTRDEELDKIDEELRKIEEEEKKQQQGAPPKPE